MPLSLALPVGSRAGATPGTGGEYWVEAECGSIGIMMVGWGCVFALCSNTTPRHRMPAPSACSTGEAKASKPCITDMPQEVKDLIVSGAAHVT